MANETFPVAAELESNPKYLRCGLLARHLFRVMIGATDAEGRGPSDPLAWQQRAALWGACQTDLETIAAAIGELFAQRLAVAYGEGGSLLFLPGRFEHNPGREYWAKSTYPLPPMELLEQHPEYLEGLQRIGDNGRLVKSRQPEKPRYPSLQQVIARDEAGEGAPLRDDPGQTGTIRDEPVTDCEEAGRDRNDVCGVGVGVGVGSTSSGDLPPNPKSHFKKGGERARARATPPPAAPAPPPPSRADAPPGARKRKPAAKPKPAPEPPPRAERIPKPPTQAQLAMLEELAAERGIDPGDRRSRITPEGRVLLWPPMASTVTFWRQWLERQPRVKAADHDADDGPPSQTAAEIEALWRRTPEMRPAVLAAELDAAPPPVRRAIIARLEEQFEAESGEAGTSLLDLVCEARGIAPGSLLGADVPFPVFGPADIPGVHRLLQQRRQGVAHA